MVSYKIKLLVVVFHILQFIHRFDLTFEIQGQLLFAIIENKSLRNCQLIRVLAFQLQYESLCLMATADHVNLIRNDRQLYQNGVFELFSFLKLLEKKITEINVIHER